jgi:tRNA-splicing ligase RtcB
MRTWLAEPLPADVSAALERLRRADDVRQVAAMPDVHLASDVCIGTVVATTHLVYPNAVGGDIGCGTAAIAFDGDADAVGDRRLAARILAGFSDLVPVLKHRTRQDLPPDLADASLSHDGLEGRKKRDAAVQLGTLGRGNHFLELQRDDGGRLWLMVHSGSRNIGQRIRDHHLRLSTKGRSGLRFLDAETEEGAAYIGDMGWALRYANENRCRIVDAASEVLSLLCDMRPDSSTLVTCHHNHVERVGTGDDAVWIHRKGAISARLNQPGIIPGSMGDPSFIVAGRGVPEALWSSSHGAGRSMSRTDARRSISIAALEKRLEGVWFDHRKARRLVDEAPQAYKNISKVMKAQGELTRIVRRLTPILSYKGG